MNIEEIADYLATHQVNDAVEKFHPFDNETANHDFMTIVKYLKPVVHQTGSDALLVIQTGNIDPEISGDLFEHWFRFCNFCYRQFPGKHMMCQLKNGKVVKMASPYFEI